MIKPNKAFILVTVLLCVLPCFGSTPYTSSRLFWDVNTERTVFSPGIYARVIQLQDGRLMAACCWGGIRISFSTNGGRSWRIYRQIVTNPTGINNDTPDLIQLRDGTIVVGYNPRPTSPYSEERKFGIRCVRSTDNGETWSDPIFIYDASYLFNDGCWEPSFLELPSGELQCYFSNEGNFTSSSEQSIDVCRSFDGGQTWTTPTMASFRRGCRDGMPKAILLSDSSQIVFTIEDNGWRNGFIATSIRCTLENNWSTTVGAGNTNRNIIFATYPPTGVVSAAPYLALLPSGETVASWQGNRSSAFSAAMDHLDQFVAVGNKEAKQFKAISEPFNLTPETNYANWNSVAVIDTGIVLAVASVFPYPSGSSTIKVIKGYPMNKFVAKYGRITIDGNYDGNGSLTRTNGEQVVMGNISRQRSAVDFTYDDDSLYLFFKLSSTLFHTTDTANIFHFYIDSQGRFSTRAVAGLYHFGFNLIKGTLQTCRRVVVNRWRDYVPDDAVHFAIKRSGTRVIRLEAAIPWKALGQEKAPVDRQLAVNLRLDHQNRITGTIVTDSIADALVDRSNTWMVFELIKNTQTGISHVVAKDSKMQSDSSDPAVYDLRGRRVSQPQKGIYIRKGRKVLLP